MAEKHVFPQNGDAPYAENFAQLAFLSNAGSRSHVVTGHDIISDWDNNTYTVTAGLTTFVRDEVATISNTGESRIGQTHAVQVPEKEFTSAELLDQDITIYVDPNFGENDNPQLRFETGPTPVPEEWLLIGSIHEGEETVEKFNRAIGSNLTYVQESKPEQPKEGQTWFNTGVSALYIYDGNTWVPPNPERVWDRVSDFTTNETGSVSAGVETTSSDMGLQSGSGSLGEFGDLSDTGSAFGPVPNDTQPAGGGPGVSVANYEGSSSLKWGAAFDDITIPGDGNRYEKYSFDFNRDPKSDPPTDTSVQFNHYTQFILQTSNNNITITLDDSMYGSSDESTTLDLPQGEGFVTVGDDNNEIHHGNWEGFTGMKHCEIVPNYEFDYCEVTLSGFTTYSDTPDSKTYQLNGLGDLQGLKIVHESNVSNSFDDNYAYLDNLRADPVSTGTAVVQPDTGVSGVRNWDTVEWYRNDAQQNGGEVLGKSQGFNGSNWSDITDYQKPPINISDHDPTRDVRVKFKFTSYGPDYPRVQDVSVSHFR